MEKNSKQKQRDGAMVSAGFVSGVAAGAVGASLILDKDEDNVAIDNTEKEEEPTVDVMDEEAPLSINNGAPQEIHHSRATSQADSFEPDVEIADDENDMIIDADAEDVALDDGENEDVIAEANPLTEPADEMPIEDNMVDADDVSIIDDPDFVNDANVDEYNLA